MFPFCNFFVSVIRCYSVFDSICCWICWTKRRKFHPRYSLHVAKTTCSLLCLSDGAADGRYVCVRYIYKNYSLQLGKYHCTYRHLCFRREQGWHSGESACLPPMCPRFNSWTRRHKWVEFVGSLLCSERFFLGYSGFPLSPKTNIWFDLIEVDLL